MIEKEKNRILCSGGERLGQGLGEYVAGVTAAGQVLQGGGPGPAAFLDAIDLSGALLLALT